ncbi:hypothetical protein, variant [Aphanomyces invadans]|uniref:AMP-dependent synthetase/ligase domain-containing protein n=1 Tax=Aphanomyces invadans TaxID=157072 RepID=A0A024TI28_9STRA|nr:hypothetical protein, variant [Aphanomyces invadans]ETV93246.1 hypothetical protein, variant [Aphanomyces invadans]|eukprot:XP_008878080.1 hypothetical protein, variant [Aphanomyces invadans]
MHDAANAAGPPPPVSTRKRLPSILAGNMWQVFLECAHLHPSAVAVSSISSAMPVPADPTPFHSLDGHTWTDYAARATAIARRFQSLHLRPGDGVLFQTRRNSAACTFVNMGVVGAGGAACHWRCEPHEVQFIWTTMPFKWIVTDSTTHLPLYLALPRVEGILMLSSDEESVGGARAHPKVHSYLSFLQAGDGASLPVAGATLAASSPCLWAFQPNAQGTLTPFVLTHYNVLFTATSIVTQLRMDISSSDSIVAHLPLHHVASQLIEWYVAIVARGGPLLFVFDGAPPPSILATCQPTLFFATPHTWQQLADALTSQQAQTSPPLLSHWAQTRALHNAIKLQKLVKPQKSSLGYAIARRFVFRSIKRRLGLLRARYCAAVLAPVPLDILQTFAAVDVPIYQWFGSAETTGVCCMSGPHLWNMGSSGRALPGTQIVVADPDPTSRFGEGQIRIQGPHMSPSVAVDALGFWTSPFYGLLASEGFVVVNQVQHKLVLSTGDQIPVLVYEKLVVQRAPYLASAIVVGHGCAYPSVLLVLKCKRDAKLVDEALDKSRALGSKATTVYEVQKCSLWAVALDALLDSLKHPTDVDGLALHAMPILKWRVLDTTSDDDSVLPNRRVLGEKYSEIIASLY